jgi:hypothetical protein
MVGKKTDTLSSVPSMVYGPKSGDVAIPARPCLPVPPLLYVVIYILYIINARYIIIYFELFYILLFSGEPVRVAKFMIQCIEPNPPRGCDMESAKRDPPRGRGWQRVARISKDFLQPLPEADDIRARPRWKTCAVVGAASLRSSNARLASRIKYEAWNN